ncbi:hypothetical protein BJF84_17845 [Rhodococcus sp. CUA-806]|jgi:hypothetical protein|nr:hypothetical protein BJF84_17845 [Rhodococcus sp. CUA-806]
MSEGEPDVAGIPAAVLDELAQTLAEKVDVLLDRLTDRAMATPQAGSSAWKTQWRGRDSEDGRREHTRRLYVRAVLASRAGVGLAAPPAQAPVPAPANTLRRNAARPRVRASADVDQLAMF